MMRQLTASGSVIICSDSDEIAVSGQGAWITMVHMHRHGGSGVILFRGFTAEVANVFAMASRSAWTPLPREPLTA
jgi:hypothetical protein